MTFSVFDCKTRDNAYYIMPEPPLHRNRAIPVLHNKQRERNPTKQNGSMVAANDTLCPCNSVSTVAVETIYFSWRKECWEKTLPPVPLECIKLFAHVPIVTQCVLHSNVCHYNKKLAWHACRTLCSVLLWANALRARQNAATMKMHRH